MEEDPSTSDPSSPPLYHVAFAFRVVNYLCGTILVPATFMWALGYRFCQYLCFIIGPLTILCSCFFWVTNIFSPLTKFDNSILFIGNFAIITGEAIEENEFLFVTFH